MVLYDDFESGNLDKWDYYESMAANYAQVNEGDANIPTKHLEIYSSAADGRYSTLISNGDVGSGKYIKCGIWRWDNIVSGAPDLLIRAVSSGADNTAYAAIFGSNLTRIFKVVSGSWSLLKSHTQGWAEDTNYVAEFYQEANGNLVVKRNDVKILEVINTQVTGDKIGFRVGNQMIMWADNIFVEGEAGIPLFSRGRMINL